MSFEKDCNQLQIKTHLWESNKQSYFKLNFHPPVKLRLLKALKNDSFIYSLTIPRFCYFDLCYIHSVYNFVFKSSFYFFIDCFSLQVHTWRDRYQSRIVFSWGYKRYMNNLICQNLWYRGNRHIKFYCPGFISEILTSLLITSKLLIHTLLMYEPDIHTNN